MNIEDVKKIHNLILDFIKPYINKDVGSIVMSDIDKLAQQICDLDKPLDRGKWRERIGQIVYEAQQDLSQGDWDTHLSDGEKELWMRDADQILALKTNETDAISYTQGVLDGRKKCIKPDEGGLLSPETQRAIIFESTELVKELSSNPIQYNEEEFVTFGKTKLKRLLEAQRDLTASIKDAECQERVERIFRVTDELAACISLCQKELTKWSVKLLLKPMNVKYVRLLMDKAEEWQALKKEEVPEWKHRLEERKY